MQSWIFSILTPVFRVRFVRRKVRIVFSFLFFVSTTKIKKTIDFLSHSSVFMQFRVQILQYNPSEIILICWFVFQETFWLLILKTMLVSATRQKKTINENFREEKKSKNCKIWTQNCKKNCQIWDKKSQYFFMFLLCGGNKNWIINSEFRGGEICNSEFISHKSDYISHNSDNYQFRIAPKKVWIMR